MRDTGRRLCLLAIFLSAALVRVSRGLSVRIQSGYVTNNIQDAVNAATNGDVLLVSTGVFHEAVIVSNKNLTFIGGYDESLTNRVPGGYTEISGDLPSDDTPLSFFNSTSRLDSIYLAHGVAGIEHGWFGGGFYLWNSHVVMTNGGIVSNQASYGGGAYVSPDSFLRIENGTAMAYNKAFFRGRQATQALEWKTNISDADWIEAQTYLPPTPVTNSEVLLLPESAVVRVRAHR